MSYKNDRLLEFLPWARHYARSCTAKLPSHLDHDDLQSAGVFGYLRAASRYDASRGTSFQCYCAMRIRGAVLDELRRWDWAPRSLHRNHQRITCITRTLTGQFDREPTSMELAEALGMEERDLAAYQTEVQPRQVVSFDEMLNNGREGESLSLTECMADPCAPKPDAAMLCAEDQRIVIQCLTVLSKSQVTVIVLYYLQNVPFREVAKVLAVTPSRVSQLHHLALGRLKLAWKRAQGSMSQGEETRDKQLARNRVSRGTGGVPK